MYHNCIANHFFAGGMGKMRKICKKGIYKFINF